VTHIADETKRRTSVNLARALHRSPTLSSSGLQERMFSLLFRGLVYPQIWEDPVIDMDALAIRKDDHIVAIASGGCNALSYLCAQPTRVTAVDLNGAHVALVRLKQAAALHLPDYRAFHTFFADAASRENIEVYNSILAPALDTGSRTYWDARTMTGRRRITQFSRGFYRFGLLGAFIRAAHVIARLHGVDPRELLKAPDRAAQRTFFENRLSPLVNKPLVRWLSRRPAALYGLGIPPKQYHALAADRGGDIAAVLRDRLERLACGFDLSDNYFAWQAFGRAYAPGPDAPLPPYLERNNFALLRKTADRLDVRHESMTDFLRSSPPASVDCVALLDAQDWMCPKELNDLWTQITRVARPGARVVFRTAANELLLPGNVDATVLKHWRRDDARSDALHGRDRSAIYGAFHLYRLDSDS
jgi:S-adenosylmethionine-diacylglycerol 3-amino-3-carboxypropyl transferase